MFTTDTIILRNGYTLIDRKHFAPLTLVIIICYVNRTKVHEK